MRKIIFSNILTMFLLVNLFGQSPASNLLLEDNKSLLQEYSQLSETLFKAKLGNVGTSHKKDYEKIYRSQYENIQELWEEGRVITHPELHGYVSAIVDKIIKANPALKNENMRIVLTRDYWPNAYSLGDGSIGINAGLMIHLENEAQLAFIICHEIAHFHLKHAEKSATEYVETLNSAAYQSELKKLSKQTYKVNEQLDKLALQFVSGTRRHRRDHEAEADRLAMQWLRETGYDLQAIKTTLLLLDAIDDSTRLTSEPVSSQFNFDDYPFKNRWIKKESKIFGGVKLEDENSSAIKDSLKTHPDCSKRIELLESEITKSTGGFLFSVDEAAFLRWKTQLWPEIVEYAFKSEAYSKSLYWSLALLKQPSFNEYAIFNIARIFNRMYEKQQEHSLGKCIDTESSTWNEAYNELLRMLSRLRLNEMAQINLHFCRKYKDIVMGYPDFKKEARLAEQRAKLQE